MNSIQHVKDLNQNRPQFNVGDVVLFMGCHRNFPVIIESIDWLAYDDSFGYVISSFDYPSAKNQIIHPHYVRPMIRSRDEVKAMLRVVS